ncbi:MAG TPA: hypothetical protein VNY52_04520 [Solirubrobacteraceae bacterium]|nr:hypothetical protein [Solirubrobacteraceae bacterium]
MHTHEWGIGGAATAAKVHVHAGGKGAVASGRGRPSQQPTPTPAPAVRGRWLIGDGFGDELPAVGLSLDNLALMAYTTAQARQQLLDAVAGATEEIGLALACVGEAYELLDEHNAERLEGELFRPLQMAYGRARRTHAEFAERHGLPGGTFESASAGAPSKGVRGFLDSAMEAASRADSALGALQDSMLPVEVGDAEVRAGLEEVRRLLGDLRGRTRELVRTLGR